jgi:starch phosphorylase
VQGVHVWLNVPRRPYEASGTSGMKAAVNGVINVSILDGWWCEGYSKESGWAIGHGEEYDDTEAQDIVESQALYNVLENEVIPTFYERHSGEMPLKWVSMMKASITMAMNYFSSNRMICQYDATFYKKAFEQYHELIDNNAEKAKSLVHQRERFESQWYKMKVHMPTTDADVGFLHVGDKFGVTTHVDLGELKPEEVDVQIFYGPVDSENKIAKPLVENMKLIESKDGNTFLYRHEISCESSGRYGFTTRVVPSGKFWNSDMPGFVTWGNGG